MRILLVYHFFHPDSVVSARIFSDLAEDLAKHGHQVTAFTGNRRMRPPERLAPHELWNDVSICRFSRPDFSQHSNFGRLFNSAILQLKWLGGFWGRRREFDAVIVGTDPQFAYLMFPFLRLMNRKVRLIHWAFDLYPEAIMVDSAWWMRVLAWFTRPFAWFSYRFVDDMVDIGSCMRGALRKYHHRACVATLTPWALAEPATSPDPDPEIRRELFGEAKIGLLYSGTVGHAHDLTRFIELARECRRRGIDAAFCFAGYGNCYAEQTGGITAEDSNIRLAGFASEEELAKRLASADIHMVSLRPGWEGVVVPSKFFGSLAIGRPVLFDGPESSAIDRWIEQYGTGARLSDGIAETIAQLAEDPQRLQDLKSNAFSCYRENFSREAVTRNWLKLLRNDQMLFENGRQR